MNDLLQVKRVAVIGAGIMVTGIAQLAATAGYEVGVYDASPQQLSRARREIEASLGKSVSKGVVERDAAPQALARLTGHASLEAAAAGADVVIQAAAERLPVKQSILFGESGRRSRRRPPCWRPIPLRAVDHGDRWRGPRLAADRVAGLGLLQPRRAHAAGRGGGPGSRPAPRPSPRPGALRSRALGKETASA